MYLRFASRLGLGFTQLSLCAGCSDRPAYGQEHGGCYPGGTCNAGLYCNSGFVCERIDGSVDAARDAAQSDSMDVLDVTDVLADAGADTFEAGPMHYGTPSSAPASCDDLSTGTAVPGALADNATSPLRALPIPFLFFGLPVDHVSVASNGYVQLWLGDLGPPDSDPSNVAIPNAAQPNAIVAALWTHLVPTAASAIRSAVFGGAPARHVTYEWSHWSVAAVSGSDVTFQIKLFETTDAIEFDYCAFTGGDVSGQATIGLENADGSNGVPFAFRMASAVSPSTSLRFSPTP